MDADAIRGVVLTLETLVSEPMEEGMRIVEGRTLKYWLGYICGYMLSAIESNDPSTLRDILESAPTLKEEYSSAKHIIKIEEHTHEKETRT